MVSSVPLDGAGAAPVGWGVLASRRGDLDVGSLPVHRQALVIASVLLIACLSVWLLAAQSRGDVVQAGFWFEDVTFDASEVEADRLGGGITPPEMETIESIAMSELRAAFAGFRIIFNDDRDAAIGIRVVQTLRSPMYPRGIGPAGESRGMWPIGGRGALNFRLLASNAIAHAPPDADRATKIAGIGRGIGRAAAHELAHIVLGSKDIHHGSNRNSYEYWTADRREQYYGPMTWDVAAPMLHARVGEAR
jgi:hypothetical protein